MGWVGPQNRRNQAVDPKTVETRQMERAWDLEAAPGLRPGLPVFSLLAQASHVASVSLTRVSATKMERKIAVASLMSTANTIAFYLASAGLRAERRHF